MDHAVTIAVIFFLAGVILDHLFFNKVAGYLTQAEAEAKALAAAAEAKAETILRLTPVAPAAPAAPAVPAIPPVVPHA